MVKTSLRHKILLVIFGLIMCLVLLEATLRIGGFLYLSLQEKRNLFGAGDDDFVIVCLGESTTAFGDDVSYPSQLELILNQRSNDRKFRVVNKGIPAINTSFILRHIEEYLQKYDPDLVVAMIGINDEYYGKKLGKNRLADRDTFLGSLRVVKLYNLARLHIQQYLIERGIIKPPAEGTLEQEEYVLETPPKHRSTYDENTEHPKRILKNIAKIEETLNRLSSILLKKGYTPDQIKEFPEYKTGNRRRIGLLYSAGAWYEEHGDFDEAEKTYRRLCTLMPDSAVPFYRLAEFYASRNRIQEAFTVLNYAKDLEHNTALVFLGLGRLASQEGKDDVAASFFKRLLDLGCEDYWILVELGDWFAERNQHAYAQMAYRHAIELNERNVVIYRKLADVLRADGKNAEADILEKKAVGIQSIRYDDVVLANYNGIVDAILKHDVPFISMQYPLRSNQWFRDNLAQNDRIIFVENKKNFSEALESSRYSDYFYDDFAGDFGHCTTKGNRLIAEQLADVILDEVAITKTKK